MDHADYIVQSLINRRRREQQIRRNILLLAASVAVAVFLSVLFLSFSSEAVDREHQPSYKYYKSIELSSGDTLWSIANEYMDPEHYKSTGEYIDEVMRMNSLTSDKITSGSYIIIPYYSSEYR